MKKIITKEVLLCDYCLKEGLEVEAVGILEPSKEDVCHKHLTAFTSEVRLPEKMGSEMSGFKVAVTPDYSPKLVIQYTKNTKEEIKK